MSFGNLLLILVLVSLNGFFVAVEFAVIATRRSRLDLIDHPNQLSMRLVRKWVEQPEARERLIAGSQLGITLVSLALGAVGENTFEAWLAPYFERIQLPATLAFSEHIFAALPLIIALTVVTSLHVVLGEQVPKVAVLRQPERFALLSAPVMSVFNTIFKWFVDVLDWATRMILKFVGMPAASSHTSRISLEEIKKIVSGPEVEGVLSKAEREMLSAVINLGDTLVRQISIPRFEIVAVEANTPLPEVIRVASENTITKLPVYEDSLEQIIGIAHILDLLEAMQSNPDYENMVVRDLAREALFVPETITVSSLLTQFRTRRRHMAIVLDEFGGTEGIVTLETLLSEIIGEVHNAFDSDVLPFHPLPDGTVRVEGTALLEDFNDYFKSALDEPNYDTIAGYILGRLGRIAQQGDVVEVSEPSMTLEVSEIDRLRICSVTVRRA